MALPPLPTQAKNLGGALGRVLKALASGDQLLIPKAAQSGRLAICSTCPKSAPADLPVDHRRCEHCGCYLAPKTGLATESCPEGHWDVLQQENISDA